MRWLWAVVTERPRYTGLSSGNKVSAYDYGVPKSLVSAISLFLGIDASGGRDAAVAAVTTVAAAIIMDESDGVPWPTLLED